MWSDIEWRYPSTRLRTSMLDSLFYFRNNSGKPRAGYRKKVKIHSSPMNCTEGHEPILNRRRCQRHEIDTQLHVTLLGLEQYGTLRRRSLNVSEAGIAGVFVTVWDVGTPVRLDSQCQSGATRSGSEPLCAVAQATVTDLNSSI
jgi:hypothetical protein